MPWAHRVGSGSRPTAGSYGHGPSATAPVTVVDAPHRRDGYRSRRSHLPAFRVWVTDMPGTIYRAITRMAFTVIICCVPNNPLTCSYLALGYVCPYRDAPPMSVIFQG